MHISDGERGNTCSVKAFVITEASGRAPSEQSLGTKEARVEVTAKIDGGLGGQCP